MMEQSTRMAFDLYRSVLLFMSFMRELVMMMTSSEPGHTSLITRYTMRRRLASLLWYSLVTLKKTSDASFCMACEGGVQPHGRGMYQGGGKACIAAGQSCENDWHASVHAPSY